MNGQTLSPSYLNVSGHRAKWKVTILIVRNLVFIALEYNTEECYNTLYMVDFEKYTRSTIVIWLSTINREDYILFKRHYFHLFIDLKDQGTS